jgi:hypothetical protein
VRGCALPVDLGTQKLRRTFRVREPALGVDPRTQKAWSGRVAECRRDHR